MIWIMTAWLTLGVIAWIVAVVSKGRITVGHIILFPFSVLMGLVSLLFVFDTYFGDTVIWKKKSDIEKGEEQ